MAPHVPHSSNKLHGSGLVMGPNTRSRSLSRAGCSLRVSHPWPGHMVMAAAGSHRAACPTPWAGAKSHRQHLRPLLQLLHGCELELGGPESSPVLGKVPKCGSQEGTHGTARKYCPPPPDPHLPFIPGSVGQCGSGLILCRGLPALSQTREKSAQPWIVEESHL